MIYAVATLAVRPACRRPAPEPQAHEIPRVRHLLSAPFGAIWTS